MFVGEQVRRDEGFSVAEVVIAAAILFFVLTALIGLVGASQTMGVTAKDRLVLTNAMAEHIEHIRAMDYYAIATPPSGGVAASEEATYGAYTIYFTNRVVMPDGANGEYLRTVYTNATCTIRGRAYQTSAVVHIRNPLNDTTASSIQDPDAPELEFTDGTTAENAVVYGKLTHPSGGAISLGADASSAGDKITEMKFLVGSTIVRDDAGTLGDDAVFTFLPGLADASAETGWDTTQDGVPDGLQKVIVQATDSMGRSTSIERQFIVDNEAPGTPGTPTLRNQKSTLTRYQFAASPDPVPAEGQQATTYAPNYWVRIRKSPAWQETLYGWPITYDETISSGANVLDSMFNPGPVRSEFSTDPFSRYWVRIRGVSPRGLVSADRSGAYFVSPPEVHSSDAQVSQCVTEYVKSGSTSKTTYTVSVYLTKPTFPVNFSATTFNFYAKEDTTGSWMPFTVVGTPTLTAVGDFWRVTYTIQDLAAAKALWFKVAVNVTPSGETAAGFVTSNAFGAAAIDSNAKDGTAVTTALVPDTTWTR
jgi:hypothetical protein